MSFPRARIQRFNEFPNDIPPPGSYDPKFKDKIKGLVIEKTDRFQDTRSVSSSCADCNTSTSSKSVSTGFSSFKMPQLPKKKTSAKPGQNPTPVKTGKKCDSKYDPTKELADLKVECLNKDKTIQEYEKQIEEMKEDICKLENQLLELEKQQTETEIKHKKDMDEMIQDRHLADIEMKTKLQKMHEDFQLDISKMKSEESKLKAELNDSSKIRDDLESQLEQHQYLVINLQSRLSLLENELDAREAENNQRKAESKQKTISLHSALEKLELAIDKMSKDYEQKKDELIKQRDCESKEKSQLQETLSAENAAKKCSEEKLSKIECLYSDVKSRLKEAEDELQEVKNHHSEVLKNHSQEIETLMSRHAEEVSRLVQRSEEFRKECAAEREKSQEIERKTQSMILAAKKSFDNEVQKAVEKHAATLSLMESRIKTVQESLEQREEEIAQLSIQIEELRNCSATKESSNQSLQSELDRAEAELVAKKEEVKMLKDQLRNEAAEMVTRRRRLDLAIGENQATLAAISERLAKSDTEVERLQNELEWERSRVQEHRDLLNTMRANSTLAHDQMRSVLQQLDAKKEDIDQLVVDNVAKFDAMKSLFDSKIKELNETAGAEITRLQTECDKANTYNKEMKLQLSEMVEKLNAAREMLLKVEEQYDTQSIELAQLQLNCHKFEKLYKESMKKQEESTTRLIEEQLAVEKTENYIAECTEKFEILEERKTHSEELCSEAEQDKENQEQIEDESKLELRTEWKTETDFSKLFDDRDQLESNLRKVEAEYKELADKYAAVIGHNNHKQKIQHMMQMKREKLQLKEDVDAARRIIAQQQRTIEKLRSEERNRQHSKEKENLTTSASSIVASPHKPSTPLKDRNV